MIDPLGVFLVKEQAAFGTPVDDLTGAANYFPALKGSKLDPIPEFTPVEECSAGFDQDAGVRGFVNINAELSCHMRSLGVSTAPDFGLLAKAAGMSETVTAVGGGNKYIYTPAATFLSKDLSIWHYTGGIGSNASILTKAGNCVGDWKISVEASKPATFALSGIKGKFISEAAATLITPTKDRTLYPAALGWTVSYNGVTYKLIKAEIEGGNTGEQYIDGTEAYGYGKSDIGDKKGKFTLQFYADAALALPSVGVLAGDIASAFSLVYGPTGRKLAISIAYPQGQNWTKGSVGNLTVFDVSGIITRNAITVTINNDLT